MVVVGAVWCYPVSALLFPVSGKFTENLANWRPHINGAAEKFPENQGPNRYSSPHSHSNNREGIRETKEFSQLIYQLSRMYHLVNQIIGTEHPYRNAIDRHAQEPALCDEGT